MCVIVVEVIVVAIVGVLVVVVVAAFLDVVLAIECEVESMLCSKPYIKSVKGVTRLAAVDEEARLAATPFPCGQCFNCRINKSREWTARILFEAMTHADKVFVTLTYDKDHLPEGGQLAKEDLRNFIKRLRKRLYPRRFRHFGVGEYGDEGLRPHYHVILFGVSEVDQGAIADCWRDKARCLLGRIQIGEVNKNTAQYITGYCLKKMTSEKDKYLAKIGKIVPEFTSISKQEGGIGIGVIEKIAEGLLQYKHDIRKCLRQVKIGGKSVPLGRYLTHKLVQRMGWTGKQEAELIAYQMQMIEEFSPKEAGEVYYTRIIDHYGSRRQKQIRRHKIFKQRRSI